MPVSSGMFGKYIRTHTFFLLLYFILFILSFYLPFSQIKNSFDTSGAQWVYQPDYIDESTSRPGRIDSTKNAIEWLKQFYHLNDDRIAQVNSL